MRRLRALLSITLLCVVVGVAGGLGLGYILSRRGEWLVPQPWVIYVAALLVVTGALTWLDVHRRPAQMFAERVAAAGSGEAGTETASQRDAATVAAADPPGEAPTQPAGGDGDGRAGGVVE